MGHSAILLDPTIVYIRLSDHELDRNILRAVVESTLCQRLDPHNRLDRSLGRHVLLNPILPLHLR